MKIPSSHKAIPRRTSRRLAVALLAIALGISTAEAASISNVTVTNLTAGGFTAVWQTSAPSAPGVDLFADDQGVNPLAAMPRIEITPLALGNVEARSTFESRAQRRDIAQAVHDRNISLVRVSGLQPGQTVYFRPRTFDPDTGADNLTGDLPAIVEVVLPLFTDFVPDAQLLSVDFSPLDATGMVALLSGPEGSIPLAAVVGDGPEASLATFSLSDVVDSALRTNAVFSGPVDFSISLIGGGGGSATHTLTFIANTVPAAYSSIAFFTGGETEPAYFVFDPIPGQDAGLAFTVTIRAMDSEGAPLVTYSGSVNLSASSGLALGAGATPAFESGVSTHTVRIDTGGEATLFAVDGVASGSSDPFMVSDNFGAWRNVSFDPGDLSNEDVAGLLADPDSAGIANILRYGFNLGKTRPNRDDLPDYGRVTEGEDEYLSVTFHRLAQADIAYIVQSSSDLQNWTHVETVLPGTPELVTVRDSVPMAGNFRSMRVGIAKRLRFASFMNLFAPESVRNDPSLLAPTGDPANTGITNIQRYAYNLDYTNPSPAGLPVVSTIEQGADAYLTITFNRLGAGADVQYIVQAGDPTNGWATIETIQPGVPTTVTTQDTTPLPDGSPRTMRILLELTP